VLLDIVARYCNENNSPVSTFQFITYCCLLAVFSAGIVRPVVTQAAAPITADWSLCGSQPAATADFVPPADRNVPIDLTSDSAESGSLQEYVLSGNVLMSRADQRLQADRLSYDRLTGRVVGEGDITYSETGVTLTGEHVELDLHSDRGVIKEARYRLDQRHAHGGASSVHFDDRDTLRMQHVSYSTCNPDQPDWVLEAREVTLHKAAGQGEASEATLRFKGVPFLYLPHLSFPLDERRKSGFLVPRFGTSETSGFDLSVPYYWNIAPDQDATITPRMLTKRGLQMIGEYRYLSTSGHGQLNLEALPGDNLTSTDRSLFHTSTTACSRHAGPRMWISIRYRMMVILKIWVTVSAHPAPRI